MATYTTNYNLYKPDASDDFGDFRSEFNDNMDIIDANLGGGGGGGEVVDVEVNGVSVVDGNKVAKIISYKEVTQAQYDALPSSKLTDGIAYFIKDGGGSGGSGSFLLIINAGTGETITATKDGTTLTATEVSTGIYEVEITSSGTWTISDGNNTATVDVGVYTATLSSIPEGSTVTPTDDVSIWIACGGRTENYTTVSEVLADSTCLLALLSDNNANDYLVRSTTWASAITADSNAMTDIGLNNYASNTLLSNSTWCSAICNSIYFESVLNVKNPTMTDNTHPYGECFALSRNSSAWKGFDGNTASYWYSDESSPAYTWAAYDFGSAKHIYMAELTPRQDTNTENKIEASNDRSTWVDVSNGFVALGHNILKHKIVLDGTNAYQCFRDYGRVTEYSGRGNNVYELTLYGRKDI